MSTDITIASEVAKIGAGTDSASLPATDLIKQLLIFHKSSAGYKRDIQLSGQVFYRSRITYEAIIARMTMVVAATQPDWDSFDKYTVAIPPLEKILLEFYFKLPENPRSHLPSDDDIGAGLQSIEDWVADRQMLYQSLQDLAATEFQSLSDKAKGEVTNTYENFRAHDDNLTIQALIAYFTSNKLPENELIQPRNSKLMMEVRQGIRLIQKQMTAKPPTKDIGQIVIRSFMLLYIPFALLWKGKQDSTKLLEPAVRDHLRGEAVWRAMKSLVNKLVAHFGTSNAPSLSDLEAEWDTLQKLLLKISPALVDTVGELLDLLKLSTRIRSPFRDRTAGLIRILYSLHEHVQATSANTDARLAVKRVMQDTIDSLQKVETAVTDVTSIAVDDSLYKVTEKDYTDLLETVKSCSEELKPGDWAKQVQKYDNGVVTDRDHHTRMRKRFIDRS